MPSVDNRVISMKFDNDDFQKKIGPTLANLDNLKKGLDLTQSAKNLEGLAEAGHRFNLDGIASAVEGIAGKFNTMGAVGFAVINNIVNRFITAGTEIVKGFSLQPIMDGFREFETNANSIQTILANTADKGTNLGQVTDALDNLNNYADKTIYNFGQMARNIGTFTAAGVDLDSSTSAIKGIANLAAMAGSSSDQASTVMYQLSQAMSAGTVHAQDWLSVVNAGIGGPLQKQLFEAAKALGKLPGVPLDQTFDGWVKSGGNFKASMEKGVFTADVLKTALQAMSGELTKEQLITKGYSEQQATQVLKTAQIAENAATQVKTLSQLMGTLKEAVGTGWAESFKFVIGDFEQAKELFTGLSGIFGGMISKSAETRNAMLHGWSAFGGREELIQSLRNVLWSLFSVIDSIKSAFREVFPPMTVERLIAMTQSFQQFTKKLIPTGETLDKIHRIFKGVFSLFSAGIKIIEMVGGAFFQFFDSINLVKNVGGGILEFLATLGDKATALRQIIIDSDFGATLNKYFKVLSDFINSLNFQPVLDKITASFTKFKDILNKLFGDRDVSGGMNEFSNSVGDATTRVRQRWEELTAAGNKLVEFFERAKEKLAPIKDMFTNMFKNANDSLKSADFSGIFDALNVGLIGGAILVFKKFVDVLDRGIKLDLGKGLFEKIGNSFDALTGSLQQMQNKIKAEILQKLAIAIAALTASILVLSLIDSAALTKAMTAIAVGFGQLVGALKLLDTVVTNAKDAGKLNVVAVALGIFAGAMVVFASAVKIMSTMDNAELTRSLIGMGALIAEITGMLAVFSKIDKSGLIATSIGLVGVGISLVIMASAVKIMASIDTDKMIAALTGIAGLLATLAITTKTLPQLALPDIGLGLIFVAASLVIMAKAVQMLAELDSDKMLQALMGIAALLSTLAITMKILPQVLLPDIGLGLIFVAGSLVIMAKAVEMLANLDSDKMIQGLTGIAAMLSTLAITMNVMPADAPLIGLGILLVAGAMVVMSKAVELFGAMDADKMIQALIGIGAVLAEMAIALNVMQGTLLGAAAMVVGAGALLVLYGVVKLFAELGIGNILLGLLGLGLAIGVLAVGSMALSEALPFMFALGIALSSIAAAVTLFGLGVAGIGAGIYLIALAVKTLAEVGDDAIKVFTEEFPVLAAGLAASLTAFIINFLKDVPSILEELNKVMDSLTKFLIENLPKLGEVITALIQMLLQLLADNVPNIIQVGLQLLLAFLTGIRDNIWMITTLVSDIIINFLDALSLKIQLIVDAGINLLTNFLNGIANNLYRVYDAASNILTEMIRGIDDSIQKIIDAGGDLIIHFIEGMGKKTQDIIDAGANALILLMWGMAKDIFKVADTAFTVVITFINALADSIDKHGKELRDAGANLARAIIDGLTGGLASMAGEVIEAFKRMASDGFEAFKKFFEMASPSKLMFGAGQNVAKGFSNAINADTTVSKSAENMGGSFLTSFGKTFSKATAITDTLKPINPTITPVLDDSNVKKQWAELGKLGATKPVKLDTGVSFWHADSMSYATRKQNEWTKVQNNAPPTVVQQDVKFEQNIYAPKSPNAGDVYRQTKSQFAIANDKIRELANEPN